MGTPIPVVSTKRTKIAVVGFASNTRDEAPFKDTSWEIWGLNNLWNFLPRWDRWFEMHDPSQVQALYGPEYVKFLQTATQPVYMQKHEEDVPASIPFPKAEMEKRVIGFSLVNKAVAGEDPGHEFWPSSISFMLALAVDELTDYAGPFPRALPGAELFIAGIDLLGDDEYTFQREGCAHLIGIAQGRGIKVTIPEKASLLKSAYVYGYQAGEFSPDPAITFAISQSTAYQKKQAEALAMVHTYDGAAQAFQTMATMLKHQGRGGVVGGVIPQPKEKKSNDEVRADGAAPAGVSGPPSAP